MSEKISLAELPVEKIHNGSVFRHALFPSQQEKMQIGSYNYAWLDPGSMIDPHIHPDGEERYLFLEGKGDMFINSEWIQVQIHDFVIVSPRDLHSVKNSGTVPLVFLTLRTVG